MTARDALTALIAAAFRIVDNVAGQMNGAPNQDTGHDADTVAGDLAEALDVPFDEHWPQAAADALRALVPPEVQGEWAIIRPLLTGLISDVECSNPHERRRRCASGEAPDEARAGIERMDQLIAVLSTDNRAPVEDGWRERFITTWRKPDQVLEWDHYVSEDRREAETVVGNLKNQGVRQWNTFKLGALDDELSHKTLAAAPTPPGSRETEA